tara:strand:- start:179 stop:985 length:807 start_codon:yes stop_codon:yes gene_type:complete
MIPSNTVLDFERDGVVCLRGMFSGEWISHLAQGMIENFDEPGPNSTQYTPKGQPGGFYDDYCNWQRISAYRNFVFNSPAAEIAGSLTRSNSMRIYHEHVLVKEPGTLERTPWHHDLPYYGLEGNKLCSLWLPLDLVPVEACPEFVAGSHRWGKRFVPRLFVSDENYAPVQENYEQVPDIEANRDTYEIKSWALEPGDCIVFHMLTLHGAPGTPKQLGRRRGFSTRWMGDDATFAVRPWPTSPPFPNVELPVGSVMDHSQFPCVWSKSP